MLTAEKLHNKYTLQKSQTFSNDVHYTASLCSTSSICFWSDVLHPEPTRKLCQIQPCYWKLEGSLIMCEGCDSFRECHSETLVPLPSQPLHVGFTSQNQGRIFQSSLFLFPYLYVLSSCHSVPFPETHRSSDLTSLAISCPLLQSCQLHASTGDPL